MIFVARHREGTAFLDARSWYEARNHARSRFGEDVTVLASGGPPPDAEVISVPPTLTVTELAYEHGQSLRAAGFKDGYREAMREAIEVVSGAVKRRVSVKKTLAELRRRAS